MTKLYVPGPAQIFIGVQPTPTWQFLGFSESGVQILLSPLTEDVAADYAAMMPADVAFLGEEARVSFTLSRYLESGLSLLSQFSVGKGLGGASANYLGTLYHQEGGDVQLWIGSPYVVKSDLTDMIPGWHFYSAYVADSIDQPISIRVKKPNVSFRAIPIFPVPYNTYTLYDNIVPSGLPSIT